MSVKLSPFGGVGAQFFDNNGVLLSGGKINSYAAGTTTPLATYTSSSGATPHPNPIILDSAGRIPGGEIWLDQNAAYKFTLSTSTNIVIGTFDNVFGINGYPVVYSVNVTDYGAVGDGVTDDSAAFTAANADVAPGVQILVPPGTYYLGSNVTATGRQFLFTGSSLTGPGKLIGALNQIIDPVTGAWSYGIGETLQPGSYYKFGRNASGARGLQIGGGEPMDGPYGNVFFPDLYGGWTTIMPSRHLSSAELAIQPNSCAGRCTLAVGGNTVTRTSGGLFEADFVGKRIYLGETRYKIATVNVGAQTLTVTTILGAPVTFSSAGPVTFVITGVAATGTCNTSGTIVTRVQGDPFVPLTNTSYDLEINGTPYTVASYTDWNQLVLTTSAGSQTDVPYEIYTSVDELSSAVRVHRLANAGFEENITIGAYASGYFHINAASGSGDQYPLYIGTGYEPDFSKRIQIGFQSDGYVTLGGNSGFCSLEIAPRDRVASNFVRISGDDVGTSYPGPSMTVVGADTDISLGISTKGAGSMRFATDNFNDVQMAIAPTAGATSFIGVTGSAAGAPRVYADGAATNIDLLLGGKGTGLVSFGAWSSNADAPVNGYVTIKDAAGNVRKLATIA